MFNISKTIGGLLGDVVNVTGDALVALTDIPGDIADGFKEGFFTSDDTTIEPTETNINAEIDAKADYKVEASK